MIKSVADSPRTIVLPGALLRRHAGAISLPSERDTMALVRNAKDFWAGALFGAFGAAAILLSNGYPLGTAARMGPGYFPLALGLLLLALAAILVLRSLVLRGPAPAMRNLKPLAIVLGSVFVFGLAAPRLGVALATVLLILIASSADREFRWKEAVVSSLILAAFTVAVFIYGLGLQLPIWPPFLGA
jgi:hypothetical protein